MSIRVAIAGVGNCASSLVQGVEYYKDTKDEDKIPGLTILADTAYATSNSSPRSTWMH